MPLGDGLDRCIERWRDEGIPLAPPIDGAEVGRAWAWPPDRDGGVHRRSEHDDGRPFRARWDQGAGTRFR